MLVHHHRSIMSFNWFAIGINYTLLVIFGHLFLFISQHALQGIYLIHLTLNFELIDSDTVNQIHAVSSAGTIQKLVTIPSSLTDLADLDSRLLLLRT